MTSVKRLNEGFGRSDTDQALANLSAALRALDLVPRAATNYCPHPIDIVSAEIRNAIRSLSPSTPASDAVSVAQSRRV